MFLINQAQMESIDDYCDKQFESRLKLFLENNCATQLTRLISAEPDFQASSDVLRFLIGLAKDEGCETELEFAAYCCLRLLILSETEPQSDLQEPDIQQCDPDFQNWFLTIMNDRDLPMELRCEIVMERVGELSQYEKIYQQIDNVMTQLGKEF